MSEHFNIGLDLDGVTYHWERTARYLLRTYRGCANLADYSQSWDWIEEQVSREDWAWLWDEGVKHGLYRHGHVVTGAIIGAKALCELGDVFLITSRPKFALKDTLDWLSLHFNEVEFSGLNILSFGQLKSTVRPDCDVYIDDGDQNLHDLTGAGKHVVLFDQPWNQEIHLPHNADLWLRATDGWDLTSRYGVVGLVKGVKEGSW